MIVEAPGVAGDPAIVGILLFCGERLVGVVELTETDDGFGGGEQGSGVGAEGRAAVSEVGKLSRFFSAGPGEKAFKIGVREGGGDAGDFEATVVGELLDLGSSDGHKGCFDCDVSGNEETERGLDFPEALQKCTRLQFLRALSRKPLRFSS